MSATPVVGRLSTEESRELSNQWRALRRAATAVALISSPALFIWLYLTCLLSARGVERRAARDPSARDLMHLAAGVQIALVAFLVAAFFHPIAYQFYFFAIGGLAVALKHAEMTARAS